MEYPALRTVYAEGVPIGLAEYSAVDTIPLSNLPVITRNTVGLPSVDNTSDAAKPVSTATQTALNLKLNASAAAISVANAVTFSTTGGAAPGSSFNGSAVKTVDYTTVGAAAALHTHSYQAADNDLLAIGGLVGTSGLLRKTAVDTWTLDTAVFAPNVLTGYASAAGTVAATDTVLQAINKLNGNDGLKAPIDAPTLTGTVTLPATTSIGAVSATELSYLDGVTSALQTQLTNKMPIGGTASAVAFGAVTAASVGTYNIGDQKINFASDAAIGRTVTLQLGNNNATWKDSSPYTQSIMVDGLNNYHLAFGTSNYGLAIERMRITNTGNVLLGYTSSQTGGVAKCEINGGLYVGGNIARSDGIDATGSFVAMTFTKGVSYGATNFSQYYVSAGDYGLVINTGGGDKVKINNAGLSVTGGISASGVTQSAAGFYPQGNGWRPTINYTHGFEILGDTQLRLWFKGADGVNRSTTLTLS